MKKHLPLLLALVLGLFAFVAVHFLTFPGSVPHFRAASNGGALLDTHPEFTADGVYRRMEAFGADGRAVYAFRVFTVDLLFPLALMPLFLLSMAAAIRTGVAPSFLAPLRFAPWIFLIFDLAENTTIRILLAQYPERLDSLAGVLGFVSAIKRIGMLSSLLFPIVVGVIAALRGRART